MTFEKSVPTFRNLVGTFLHAEGTMGMSCFNSLKGCVTGRLHHSKKFTIKN